MSFASYETAFRTSMHDSPRNEYMVPDVFDITSKSFYQPNLHADSIRNRMSYPEAAPNPEEGLMKEHFGNVEQQFPKEFYEADMKAREHEALPQFEDQPKADDDMMSYVRECEERIAQLEAELADRGAYDLPEHMVNAIIYIISGIFMLFLLDIFVKLGRLLR